MRRLSSTSSGSTVQKYNVYIHAYVYVYKASQPRGRASGSRAYGRHEMQGVIFKSTRHECSVFVNLWPLVHAHYKVCYLNDVAVVIHTRTVKSVCI